MSSFFDYTPYFGQGMQQFQPGQQPVDAKYLSDPLMQKLFQDQVKGQLINAFAPQQGQGGFLEQLLGSIPAPAPLPTTTPTTTPVATDPKKKKQPSTMGPTSGNPYEGLVEIYPNWWGKPK